MGLLHRRRSPADAATFWGWWSTTGREQVLAALSSDDAAACDRVLTPAVQALDPGLVWEIGPGELSAWVLVVSPQGDPALRSTARRWLLAAPLGDDTWSFSDHRPPVPDPGSGTLSLDGAPEMDLARVTVTAHAAGSRLDVVVHHPAFDGLPAHSRDQLAFLALDGALGENDVELWLGSIESSGVGVVDGFGLEALRAVVADLRAQHLDPDGRPAWTLLRGETAAGPLLALAQRPLHPLTAAQLTRHVAVALPCAGRGDEGLPSGSSLEALRALQDELDEAMGDGGAVLATESCAGTRTLHAYVDPTTDAETVLRRRVRSWREGRARVASRDDPAWEQVRHLRS